MLATKFLDELLAREVAVTRNLLDEGGMDDILRSSTISVIENVICLFRESIRENAELNNAQSTIVATRIDDIILTKIKDNSRANQEIMALIKFINELQ